MFANKKVELGQFYTKESLWLKPQIRSFISLSNCHVAYDPFAGGGDLLSVCEEQLGFKQVAGLDIDDSLCWQTNDSLRNIPTHEDAIIITNPPYIAKQSATRKKIDLKKYFETTVYDDVYLLALDKMLDAQEYVVAIIPESFINSSFKRKNRLSSITILEENPFEDTENPVCVACFDGRVKDFSQIKIYKNNLFINDLKSILDVRIEPKKDVDISFNSLQGWLGIRAVDSTDDKTFIKFDYKENIDYDWENKIKVSSRHYTLINIDVEKDKREEFIKNCNETLEYIRHKTADILLTPFMGNTKKGVRRRRLDFKLARAILETAYRKTKGIKRYEQFRLL